MMEAAPSLFGETEAGRSAHAPLGGGFADFDSPLEVAAAERAERVREESFLKPLLWEGRALEPWSLLRHAMHRRLMMHLCPVPKGLWGEDIEAHAPDAMLFLWLASHPKDRILVMAGQPLFLWLNVFEWAERELPRGLWGKAVELMLGTFDAGLLTEVVVRPEGGGKGGAKKPRGRSRARRPRSSGC